MSRVSQYLELISDPGLPSLSPGDPSDGVLWALLVHLAFSDGVVQGDEFALLERVRADLDPSDLMEWAMAQAMEDFDVASLAAVVARGEAPIDVLRFAARMICLDGDVADEEQLLLVDLASTLGLGPLAPSEVIDEIVARGGTLSTDRVTESLRNMMWVSLVPRRGDPEAADMVVAAPNGEAVCTLNLGDEEVGALYIDGLLARFDDGPAFVPFDRITTYTRVPVPGAGFHLRTVTGDHHSVSNHRMRDLGALLDYLFEVPK